MKGVWKGVTTAYGVVVGIIGAVVGFASILWPGLRDQFAQSSSWLPWLLFFFSVAVGGFITGFLQHQLSEARAYRPTPSATDRDKKQFDLALSPAELDWTTKFLAFLNGGAWSGKDVRDVHIDGIEALIDSISWRERFWDDAHVSAAWGNLRTSITKLLDFFAVQFEGDATVDDYGLRSVTYRLRSPRDRDGGQAEWEEARAEARRLSSDVIERRREFERVGRQRLR